LVKFREGATAWLSEWDSARVLGHFNDVPEESLNTVIWKSVTRASRTLGASASLLRKYLDGQSSVEECLGRISETFQDEPESFERAKRDLETVRNYLEGFAERGRVERYVLTAAASNDSLVEAARAEALAAIAEFGSAPDQEHSRRIGYTFSKFQSAFISHYVDEHDSVMRSHDLQEKAAELFESNDWWFYRNICDLVSSDLSATNITTLLTNLKRLDCSAKTQELLANETRCACGFEIASRQSWESIVTDLTLALHLAIDEHLERLSDGLQSAVNELAGLSKTAKEDALRKSILDVETFVRTGAKPAEWNGDHARAFRLANAHVNQSSNVRGSDDEPFLTEADIESAVLSLA
ncbi:MAG TPA: DUF6079 family protein, partial [Pyrinomonadaceae bacterium]|nr:DUF6079 family protein [Pyrinomonadaceae bacterium]